jgi:hypothetical protein
MLEEKDTSTLNNFRIRRQLVNEMYKQHRARILPQKKSLTLKGWSAALYHSLGRAVTYL